VLLAVVSLTGAAITGGASAQQLYRWVDEHGVVHYGDRVPPEYAGSNRDVLNEQGVAVRSERGPRSEMDRAEQARLEAEAAAEREARAEVARRDRMLLETYLSVADIEDVRDQRLDMLESQISVTEQYLATLKRRLEGLHREARAYSPYNDAENARPMPAQLANEITRTESSIRLYEENLDRTREEQETLRESFARDIARFKELKGG
jgi:hypothetical protein